MLRSFFLTRRWFAWSILGTAMILLTTWYRVQLDVQINDWFGTFYDLVQKALGTKGSVTLPEFWKQLSTFLNIAMIYVTVALAILLPLRRHRAGAGAAAASVPQND